jgi:hypothetical protein
MKRRKENGHRALQRAVAGTETRKQGTQTAGILLSFFGFRKISSKELSVLSWETESWSMPLQTASSIAKVAETVKHKLLVQNELNGCVKCQHSEAQKIRLKTRL